jgi:rubrerythrin
VRLLHDLPRRHGARLGRAGAATRLGMGRASVARRELVRVLRAAFSGERAAALAYRGHWRASADPEERVRIRAIEDDEWRHRERVGGMLAALGARPSRLRELRSVLVGSVLQLLCPVSGWLLPMVAARRLEVSNVCAYDVAAAWARGCSRDDLVPALLEMAAVERDHERYFSGLLSRHALARRFGRWTSRREATGSSRCR